MIATFKPQFWHVEERNPSRPADSKADVLGSFISRTVAEETRDILNNEFHHIGEHGHAYICMCDCPDRKCLYRDGTI